MQSIHEQEFLRRAALSLTPIIEDLQPEQVLEVRLGAHGLIIQVRDA